MPDPLATQVAAESPSCCVIVCHLGPTAEDYVFGAFPELRRRTAIPEENFIEVGALKPSEAELILDAWLVAASRSLTAEQRDKLLEAAHAGGVEHSSWNSLI